MSDRDRESDVYLELGRTLFLDGKPDAALGFLKKALLLTSVPNLTHHAAVHYLYLGEAYAKLGDPRFAERFLEKAVELAERYAAPETRWRALHKLALVLIDEGRQREGAHTLKRCIETIEQLRSQYLPESLKISLLSSKERPYEDMVTLLCSPEVNGTGDVDARELEEAFRYVERAKSRIFAEQLSGTDLGSAGLPAELLGEEKSLILRLKALQTRHRAAAEPQRYDWGEEVAEVESRLRELREKMRQSGPRGAEYASLREASPLGHAQIWDLLREGKAGAEASPSAGTEEGPAGRIVLAQYFTTNERTMLLVGRDGLEVSQLYEIDVNREDLWKWRNVFDDLDGDDLNSWDLNEWQDELGRLIEPITHWSEEGDIVWLVPHGELHRLPLHALKIEDRYLIERNPVCYTPSASVMGYCKAKYTGRHNTALVLGDSLNDLPYAPEEARMVAELLGVEPYLGDQASKSLVKDSLESASGAIDVLHFACHGKYDWKTPLRSHIKLASSRSGGDNAEEPDLTAEEILDLEMRANLVTLSACESGVSDRRPGDELIGLTRSLIFAGTPSVVASLWSVNDMSTGALMEDFYRSLLGSGRGSVSEPMLTKAQALQAAQLHVMKAQNFRHPYYWAPFILVGDWR